MPPKRKRAAEGAVAEPTMTRGTRSSTRNKTATTGDAAAGPSTVFAEDKEAAVEPAPKKQRKAPAAKAAPKKKAAAKTKSIKGNAAQVPADAQSGDTETSKPTKSPVKPKAVAVEPAKLEPYSPARATDLFAAYADEDDKDVIGPEGFEKLCSDAGVSLEGALPLILAWQFGATEMAKVKRGEWEKGTAELRISCLPALSTALHELENLLILDKPPLKHSTATKKTAVSVDPYNRSRYLGYAADTTAAYTELYMFLFVLSKPPQSRNIDMETACAMWSVCLAPRYPLVNDIIAFINDKGTYKAVTKDIWSMMLEFCRTVSPNLDNYDADGAWPTLLDDFMVEQSKADSANGVPTTSDQ
ncbi:hypothetical protein EUX98_g8026 [Antrodiella citrinella]|uniref:Defective in cullin neddylation protein n=1 Tax=Antrodiella citrinella TaxID=2447956 RepID=A0A4S4MEQ5_9APHY|nr:hypothetical protein EUX98_g8026 [Antrodiella citrinella]